MGTSILIEAYDINRCGCRLGSTVNQNVLKETLFRPHTAIWRTMTLPQYSCLESPGDDTGRRGIVVMYLRVSVVWDTLCACRHMVSSAAAGCRHSRLASLVAIALVVCITHLALSPDNLNMLYETSAVSESKHSLRAVGVQELRSPVPKVRPNVWYDTRHR
jgi:hypothetical protein